MLAIVSAYLEAWQAKDGDLVASCMTVDAVFEYHEHGTTFAVADGSLQSRIANGPDDSMRTFERVLVYDEIVVITFTKCGDVAISGERVFLGPDR